MKFGPLGSGVASRGSRPRGAMARWGRRTRAAGAALLVGGVVGASAIVALGSAPAGASATITVANCNASGAGSLSDAVTQANGDSGDTIGFSPGLSCTDAGGNAITVTSTLTLTAPMSISGAGATIDVSGGGTTEVLSIDALPSTISGLTIEDGLAGVNAAFDGGGVGVNDFEFGGNGDTERRHVRRRLGTKWRRRRERRRERFYSGCLDRRHLQ